MQDYVELFSDRLSEKVKMPTFNLKDEFKYDGRTVLQNAETLKKNLFDEDIPEDKRWRAFNTLLIDMFNKLQNYSDFIRIENEISSEQFYFIETLFIFAEQLSVLWLIFSDSSAEETSIWPSFMQLILETRALLDPTQEAIEKAYDKLQHDPRRELYIPMLAAISQVKFGLGAAIKPDQVDWVRTLSAMDLKAFYRTIYSEQHLTGGVYWMVGGRLPSYAEEALDAFTSKLAHTSSETRVLATILALRAQAEDKGEFLAEVCTQLMKHLKLYPESITGEILDAYIELASYDPRAALDESPGSPSMSL